MCVQDKTQMVYCLTTLALLIVLFVWYYGRKRFQESLRDESGGRRASLEWKKQDKKIRRLSRVKIQLSKEKVESKVKKGKKPRK